MTDFGDFDPEDEYDAGDPLPVRLAVIGRIIEALEFDADRDRRARRRAGVVRLLAALTAEVVAGGE